MNPLVSKNICWIRLECAYLHCNEYTNQQSTVVVAYKLSPGLVTAIVVC